MRPLRERIETMYQRDRAVAYAFVIGLWLALIFVFFQVWPLIPADNTGLGYVLIIAGAAVSSLVQAAVPREALALTSVSSRFLIHPLVMICAAFLLSVCSTSDAFIARGFSSAFSHGSVLAFMTAGPMIDVKNILMMLPYFRKRFIIVLSLLVCLMTYLSAVAASFLFFGVN